jgi:YHS domain-containing protein
MPRPKAIKCWRSGGCVGGSIGRISQKVDRIAERLVATTLNLFNQRAEKSPAPGREGQKISGASLPKPCIVLGVSDNCMKNLKLFTLMTLVAGALVATLAVHGADAKPKEAAKPKPYPLTTCIVADDKLDKDAYVFVHEGQEIKLCCESCKDDFKKEPAKYLKKITDAGKKGK